MQKKWPMSDTFGLRRPAIQKLFHAKTTITSIVVARVADACRGGGSFFFLPRGSSILSFVVSFTLQLNRKKFFSTLVDLLLDKPWSRVFSLLLLPRYVHNFVFFRAYVGLKHFHFSRVLCSFDLYGCFAKSISRAFRSFEHDSSRLYVPRPETEFW